MNCAAFDLSQCSGWLPWIRAEEHEANLEAKLGDQLALHQAQIRLLDRQIGETTVNARAAVAAGKADDARKLLKARRILTTKRARYEQLVAVCQNTMDTITEGVNVRDTIGVLAELRGTFRRLDNANVFGQLEGAVDDLGSLQSELTDAQLTMTASNSSQFDDGALEAELEALLADDPVPLSQAMRPVAEPSALVAPAPQAAPHSSLMEGMSPQASAGAAQRTNVHQRYAAAGVAIAQPA